MVAIGGEPFGISVSDTAITVAHGATLAPSDTRFALSRRLLNGAPDPSFGTNGEVIDDISGAIFAYVVDAEGRHLLAGLGGVNNDELEIARYLDTGARDPMFGFAGANHVPLTGLMGGEVVGLAVASNGRILVGLDGNELGVVALTNDGMLDTKYGSGGSTWYHLNVNEGVVSSLVRTPYDGIVLAGSDNRSPRMLAVRLTASGAVDTCFDGDGLVLGPTGVLAAALVQDTGALVLVGTEQVDPTTQRIVLARYTP